MNRFKKEEKVLAGTSVEGFPNTKSEQTGKISKVGIYLAVRKMHMELFPEEYSFMMDSHIEVKSRARNESPFNEEFLKNVNKRRAALGVSHFDGVDTGISNDTWQFCRDKLGL